MQDAGQDLDDARREYEYYVYDHSSSDSHARYLYENLQAAEDRYAEVG